jgi:hypothetical protein
MTASVYQLFPDEAPNSGSYNATAWVNVRNIDTVNVYSDASGTQWYCSLHFGITGITTLFSSQAAALARAAIWAQRIEDAK